MIITYLATPIMIVSGIPQIIILLKNKNSKGVSLNTFILTWFAVLLLFIEATIIKAYPLMLADFCSLLVLTINIYLINKYK